ncbi:MAG: hypothetical protein PF961_02310 [Planctomycetota bacterium]|jgi:predicted peptidase|nr:hypothetical protein [Planctomycetota bacterium]
MLRALIIVCLCAPVFAAAVHQARPKGTTSAPYGYVEYLPPGYATDGPNIHPVVIFLHGAGEKGAGTDATALWDDVTVHGPSSMILSGSTRFADENAIVLSPQTSTGWDDGFIDDLVDYALATYRIDPNRVYLTGLSMGGGGTYGYLSAHGNRIAACIPICGAGGVSKSSAHLSTPTWSFHAWGDNTVKRSSSINASNAIAKAVSGSASDVLAGYPHVDGNPNNAASETKTATYTAASGWTWRSGVTDTLATHPKLTFYTDKSHDSWTRTYNNSLVWDWLFRQGPPRVGTMRVELSGTVTDGVTELRYGDAVTTPSNGRFNLSVDVPLGTTEIPVSIHSASGVQERTLLVDRSTLGDG